MPTASQAQLDRVIGRIASAIRAGNSDRLGKALIATNKAFGGNLTNPAIAASIADSHILAPGIRYKTPGRGRPRVMLPDELNGVDIEAAIDNFAAAYAAANLTQTRRDMDTSLKALRRLYATAGYAPPSDDSTTESIINEGTRANAVPTGA